MEYNDTIIKQEIEVNPKDLEIAINHLNWGAFGFTWIWGLGNGSFKQTWPYVICDLIPFIPFVNYLWFLAALVSFGFRIYFLINGNKWAYENRAWWSLTDFTETQKRWAILTAICVILGFITIISFVFLGALRSR